MNAIVEELKTPPTAIESGRTAEEALAADTLGVLDRWFEEYGGVHYFDFGGDRVLLLHDAEAIGQALWKKGANYGKSKWSGQAIEPVIGRSVGIEWDQERHADIKKIVLRAFSKSMLDAYFNELVATVSSELQALDEYARTGQPVDLQRFALVALFRVLMKTLVSRGIPYESYDDIIEWCSDGLVYMGELRKGGDWRKSEKAVQGEEGVRRLHQLVDDLIEQRLAEPTPEPGGDVRIDAVDILLQAQMSNGQPLDRDEVRGNVVNLLFGGHESTTVTFAWTAAELIAAPRALAELRKEIDTLVGSRPLVVEDLKTLKYVGNAFNEAIRLYPNAILHFYEAKAPDVLVGYPVEAGEKVATSNWTVHRDPKWWPDPSAFRPERYTEAENEVRARGAFIAFGLGPRSCPGERLARMEAAAFITLLFRDFDVEFVDGKKPAPSIANSMGVTPDGGVNVYVRRRGEDGQTPH